MNALVDPTIRDALGRIVAATPAVGPTPDPHVARLSAPRPRRQVAIAAAAIAVVGAAGALALATRGPSDRTPAAPGDTTGSPPSATEPAPPDSTRDPAGGVEPTLTVPDDPNMVPVPMTMAPDSPTAWYRLQPDLLITWKAGDGTTQLCWRTPIEEQCGADIGHGEVLLITSAGGQAIVVSPDPAATSATVEAQDGTPVTVQLERDPQLSWGVGRYETTAAPIDGAPDTSAPATTSPREASDVTG
jgi:hypothetical protein